MYGKHGSGVLGSVIFGLGKMARLTKRLEAQFAESARLDKVIRENLQGLRYGS